MSKLPPLAPEIAHLKPEEIENLYTRYLSGENAGILQEEYRIAETSKNLVSLFPPLILNENPCPYCDCAMTSKRRTKTQRASDLNLIKCLECGHFEDPQSGRFKKICNCKPCKIKRKEEEERREVQFRERIKEKYDPEQVMPIAYEVLDFKHKLTLISLLRCQTPESFDHIVPLTHSHRNHRLSPTAHYTEHLITSLQSVKAIIIDPGSSLHLFRTNTPDPFSVRWLANITLNGITRASLEQLFVKLHNDFEENLASTPASEIKELLFQIPQEEVIQYLHLKADILDVSFGAESKTPTIIRKLLETHSTAQLYTLASNAVDNAHLFREKKHVSHRHAANTIPGKMLSLAEKHVANGREVFEFSRDRDAPRSELSKVFFDLYLGETDAVFNCSPGKYWNEVLKRRLRQEDDQDEPTDIFCPECGSFKHSLRMKEISIYLTCGDCDITSTFSLS
ncbi:MAG: hypothetical protein ACOH2R_05565 [Pseudomonas sp.]